MHRTTAPVPTPITVVWDWNGTLRDDVKDHLDALNATLPDLGISPITLERYRAEHRTPIRAFYDALLDRVLDDQQWHDADAAFQRELAQHPVRLQPGARDLMLGLRARGIRQSLLSLSLHDRLLTEVRAVGITGLLDRVDGRHEPVVGSKAPAMARHLAALGPATDPARTLVIGDTVDDALAALSVGAVPVLHTRGLHSPERLATAGVPVADSLKDAVDMGLAIINSTGPEPR
ncbi:HAD family hydrolase [Kitasatospora sp. NRRL B-11411]|uniref:HAD family hydrolase n=1 Tax=Kitasatospora sp. NRRL B-11411 TaxID=1463822 RepID=UPI001E64F0AD|nr:HAD family hydrolase [Kitasatospora sp. NRRL B-11411]